MNKKAGENMKKKIIIGATTLLLMTTLTWLSSSFWQGCSYYWRAKTDDEKDNSKEKAVFSKKGCS